MEIRRVLAPNPGLFTGPGTNTYVLRAGGEALVLDPGPVIDSHRAAIEETIGESRLVGVVVTHTHSDHAPLANPMARDHGVPAIGFEPGPEFDPDRRLAEGDVVKIGPAGLKALYTPGHADDHLCFLHGTTLFTGDHIMGGSTVMVQDMGRYLMSLERLKELELARILPGHGEAISDPAGIIDYYIEHRLEREREVIDALRGGAQTVGGVVGQVYRDVDREYHPLAAISVAAHVRKLAAEGKVVFHEKQADELWEALIKMVDAT